MADQVTVYYKSGRSQNFTNVDPDLTEMFMYEVTRQHMHTFVLETLDTPHKVLIRLSEVESVMKSPLPEESSE